MIFFNEKNEKNMDCWQKKIDIESQNFAIFTARFLSAVDLPKTFYSEKVLFIIQLS